MADWTYRGFHSLVRSGNNRLSFRLFPVFHAEKTGGSVPDPELPDGSSPTLPTELHEGRTLSRCVSRSRGRAPLLRHRLECRHATVASYGAGPGRGASPHTGWYITSAAWLSSSLTAASTRVRLPLSDRLPHLFAASPGCISPRASRVPPTAPSCGRSTGGRSHTPLGDSPAGPFPTM